MKDNFSTQSDQYARFRPGYPPEFFNYLNSILLAKDSAWDCGTGKDRAHLKKISLFSSYTMNQPPTITWRDKYKTLHLWMLIPMAFMQWGIFKDYWGDFSENAWSVHVHYITGTI